VFVMGHRMSPHGPFLIQFSGMTRKVFTYDAASLADFENSTRRLASFRPAITGEEFEVYLLK